MIALIIVFSFAGLLTYFARRIDAKKDILREQIEKTKAKKITLIYNSEPPEQTYMKPLMEYYASEKEILDVEKQIEENGFWEEHNEWRISTVTSSRIEPKIKNDEKWFETTVKCEQEIKIPAKTIERAIIFRKVYEDIQKELWHKLGWASWTKKDQL